MMVSTDKRVQAIRAAPPCPLDSRQLRTLVLDYLLKTCAVDTAQAFVRDWPAEMDGKTLEGADGMDGVEVGTSANGHATTNGETNGVNGAAECSSSRVLLEQTLSETKARRDIHACLSNGRVQAAIDLCNANFPALLAAPPTTAASTSSNRILSDRLSPSITGHSRSAPALKRVRFYAPAELADPALLSLDLQIQTFIESVRSAATSLTTGPSPMEASTHLPPPADAEVTSTSSTGSSLSYSAFSTALILAQTLHAQASALPSASHRARYLKELETVSGLIAYQNPEESPVRHFLDVQRRKVLADGVDRAILLLLSQEPTTALEKAVKQAEVVWQGCVEERIPYPSERGKEKALPVYPSHLRLPEFLDSLHSD